MAGKRAGLKHEGNGDDETTRSGLFMEAVRIIEEMRDATNNRWPTFAIWENVPGAFSSNKGEDFRTVLLSLARIKDKEVAIPRPPKGKWLTAGCIHGDGWSIAWRTVDAQHFGVPQRRRRIFLVADFAGNRAAEISFERESLSWDSPQKREARKKIAGYPSYRSGANDRESIYGADLYNGSITGDKAKAIREADSDADHIPCVCFQGDGADMGEHTNALVGDHNSRPTDMTCLAVYPFRKQANPVVVGADIYNGKVTGDQACTLTAGGNDSTGSSPKVVQAYGLALQSSSGFGAIEDEAMPTLINGDNHGWQNGVCCLGHDERHSMFGEDGKSDTLLNSDWKDPQRVAYGIDVRNLTEHEEVYGTLQEKPNGGQSLNFSGAALIKKAIQYIVRRLTPTECARLQGFPDTWGHLTKKTDMTDTKVKFWNDVYVTHQKIVFGRNAKPKTKEQLITWYNKLWNDGNEYKMWGNGVALPCVDILMQGIARCGAKTMASLFDGSGGFPLAAVMNGIEPKWCSEIEPYPIAVTVERFGEELCISLCGF